jgi:hypothetical protein
MSNMCCFAGREARGATMSNHVLTALEEASTHTPPSKAGREAFNVILYVARLRLTLYFDCKFYRFTAHELYSSQS